VRKFTRILAFVFGFKVEHPDKRAENKEKAASKTI
jgi:hypothetical protein